MITSTIDNTRINRSYIIFLYACLSILNIKIILWISIVIELGTHFCKMMVNLYLLRSKVEKF